jgi:hypothetical protein
MNIPANVFTDLEQELPEINVDSPNYILVDFVYEGEKYSIYFYKVSDYGKEFWLCNPNQVHDRIDGK